MRLKIISRYPTGKTQPTPLLFVHGAFAAAEIWDVHFLPYFAQHGYSAYALSLRGHGASEGRAALGYWRLADYVTDLAETIRNLPGNPILIGHSMGGMVIQKYLESHRAAGVVLMASVPPQGILASLWGMAISNPLLLYKLTLIQLFGAHFADMTTLREAMFSHHTPDTCLEQYLSKMQQESHWVSLDMLGCDPLRLLPHHGIPMLVMGAAQDAFFSTGLIRSIARHYNAEVVIFPDMAHAMMLEANWKQPADHLLHWLRACFPTL
jgi:pimeloyl-ACP methyl ester carboxylesterase